MNKIVLLFLIPLLLNCTQNTAQNKTKQKVKTQIQDKAPFVWEGANLYFLLTVQLLLIQTFLGHQCINLHKNNVNYTSFVFYIGTGGRDVFTRCKHHLTITSNIHKILSTLT